MNVVQTLIGLRTILDPERDRIWFRYNGVLFRVRRVQERSIDYHKDGKGPVYALGRSSDLPLRNITVGKKSVLGRGLILETRA